MTKPLQKKLNRVQPSPINVIKICADPTKRGYAILNKDDSFGSLETIIMTISALNSGISAMRAFESALDSSANNIANTNTSNFSPQVNRFQEGVNGGVIVNISQASKALTAQSDGKTKSQANGTDLGTEITNSLQYKIGFQMAAKLVKTSDEILDTLVNMKK